MARPLLDFDVADGELVDARHMSAALTAGPFVFADGAWQTFSADGNRTTYAAR